MKKVLSGIQPSGNLCISNYLGAIKNWVKLQDTHECIYLIVDLHSLTVEQKPADLRNRCYSFAAQYIACGINPEKSIIAVQSHLPQHSELMWVLSTLTYLGELNRMTQFKDKTKGKDKSINLGLFSYPVLMASDILLYQADFVPVGADQKQHLELSRDIANRFNTRYSDTFTLPEPYIPKEGARIMSLQDPSSKMSKSDTNDSNYISLLDNPDVILKKIKRSVTDSGTEITYSDKKPGLQNLINIYSSFSDISVDDIVKRYEGKMYSDLKVDLADIIIDKLKPVQDKYNILISDKSELDKIFKIGRDKAAYLSNKTLSKVYRKIGLIKSIK